MRHWRGPRTTTTGMRSSPAIARPAKSPLKYIFDPLRPRSDIALINGMIHLLIENNLVNREYIAQHTTEFAALEESVRAYMPERVSRITGLTTERIFKAAWIFGNAKAPFIGRTMGVNHSTKGTETVNAINNLALITGNVGRPGASPFSITGQCNAMGSREASFTSSPPGYRKFENAEDREELAALWGVSAERIPTSRGLAYPDIIEAMLAKKIRALWIVATNPIVSYPNLDVLTQSLENLEFFVVQDGFHPTPTSDLADLVLPAAIWGEKEGTYTNSERRVSKVNRAVNPPDEARSDFEIFLALAKKLRCYQELFSGWERPKDAFEEWKKVSAGRLCDYSGMDYEWIEKSGGIQWPFPAGTTEVKTTRLYEDGIFPTEDGKAKLICVEWKPFPEQPNSEFPFVLNTGRTVEHWHTRTKTGQVPILERLSPNAWLEMNPRDATALHLKPHDRADIESTRDRIGGIELRITEIIAPGQVFMPFHFAETNVNQMTQSAFDPISREPNYKQCAIRVMKTAGLLDTHGGR